MKEEDAGSCGGTDVPLKRTQERSASDAPVIGNVIVVGDLMRISVQLIEQWKDEQFGVSELVKVVEIRREPDGTKTIFMERVYPFEWSAEKP